MPTIPRSTSMIFLFRSIDVDIDFGVQALEKGGSV